MFAVNRPSIGLYRSSVRLFLRSSVLAAKDRSLADVPVHFVGTLNDYYVPPALRSAPITKWPTLIGRRMMLFATNTYSVIKMRNDTSLKPKFNEWKSHAVDVYIETNRAFAAKDLGPVQTSIGRDTYNILNKRILTLPKSKIEWKLTKIVKTPKIIGFLAIPDADSTTGICQFCMNLETIQDTVINNTTYTRRMLEYLVYTVNPFHGELALVGKVFPADVDRKLLDSVIDQTDPNAFEQTSFAFADIFRANPVDKIV